MNKTNDRIEKQASLNKPQYAVGDCVFARNYSSCVKWFLVIVNKNFCSAFHVASTERGLWKDISNQFHSRLRDIK